MARKGSQNSGGHFGQAVQQYVNEVAAIYASGKYNEKSFRTAFENLLNTEKPNAGYTIRQEQTSQTSKIGIPDYTVYNKG